VCCSVLQCVAVCWECVAVCCSVVQCDGGVLQCVAVCCIVLQFVAVCLATMNKLDIQSGFFRK